MTMASFNEVNEKVHEDPWFEPTDGGPNAFGVLVPTSRNSQEFLISFKASVRYNDPQKVPSVWKAFTDTGEPLDQSDRETYFPSEDLPTLTDNYVILSATYPFDIRDEEQRMKHVQARQTEYAPCVDAFLAGQNVSADQKGKALDVLIHAFGTDMQQWIFVFCSDFVDWLQAPGNG